MDLQNVPSRNKKLPLEAPSASASTNTANKLCYTTFTKPCGESVSFSQQVFVSQEGTDDVQESDAKSFVTIEDESVTALLSKIMVQKKLPKDKAFNSEKSLVHYVSSLHSEIKELTKENFDLKDSSRQLKNENTMLRAEVDNAKSEAKLYKNRSDMLYKKSKACRADKEKAEKRAIVVNEKRLAAEQKSAMLEDQLQSLLSMQCRRQSASQKTEPSAREKKETEPGPRKVFKSASDCVDAKTKEQHALLGGHSESKSHRVKERSSPTTVMSKVGALGDFFTRESKKPEEDCPIELPPEVQRSRSENFDLRRRSSLNLRRNSSCGDIEIVPSGKPQLSGSRSLGASKPSPLPSGISVGTDSTLSTKNSISSYRSKLDHTKHGQADHDPMKAFFGKPLKMLGETFCKSKDTLVQEDKSKDVQAPLPCSRSRLSQAPNSSSKVQKEAEHGESVGPKHRGALHGVKEDTLCDTSSHRTKGMGSLGVIEEHGDFDSTSCRVTETLGPEVDKELEPATTQTKTRDAPQLPSPTFTRHSTSLQKAMLASTMEKMGITQTKEGTNSRDTHASEESSQKSSRHSKGKRSKDEEGRTRDKEDCSLASAGSKSGKVIVTNPSERSLSNYFKRKDPKNKSLPRRGSCGEGSCADGPQVQDDLSMTCVYAPPPDFASLIRGFADEPQEARRRPTRNIPSRTERSAADRLSSAQSRDEERTWVTSNVQRPTSLRAALNAASQ